MEFLNISLTIIAVVLLRATYSFAQTQCVFNGTINIVLLEYPPFLANASSITVEALANGKFTGLKSKTLLNCIVGQCRKKSPKIDWRITSVQNEKELFNKLFDNNVDIIYPLPPNLHQEYRSNITESDASHSDQETRRFIPVHGSSKQGHFVNIENCRTDLSKLIFTMIYKQWPIFTLMLLLASIAGIIVWFLESRVNKDEFAVSFLPGGFDGFWWAFVSMTTVGYGDKTPRSVIGRLFSVLWIFVGITIVSFFTATITSAITIATVKNPCEQLENRTVAVLNHSEVISHVINNGGDPRVYSIRDIKQMFDDLNDVDNKIDSMLIDTELANYFTKDIKGFENIKKVKAEEAAEIIFYMMVTSNHVQSNTCIDAKYVLDKLHLKATMRIDKFEYVVLEEEVVQPLSLKSPETWPFMYTLVVLTVGLIVLGVVQDLLVRIRRHRSKNTDDETSTCLEALPSSSGEPSASVYYQTHNAICSLTQEIKEIKQLMMESMERLSTIERQTEFKKKPKD